MHIFNGRIRPHNNTPLTKLSISLFEFFYTLKAHSYKAVTEITKGLYSMYNNSVRSGLISQLPTRYQHNRITLSS